MATVVLSAKSLAGFINTAFKYNLQVFPDTITAGALLFSMLFQSPPLATLGASFILLNFLHPSIAALTTRAISATLGADADPGMCSGHFPGVSYEDLLSLSSERTMGALSRPGWPSFYTVFMGYLAAWVGALPALYNREITASPRRMAAATFGMVVLGLVLLIALVYRVGSGCDTVFGSLIGMAVGAVLGGLVVFGLAWVSDRRLTNLLNFPLIRGKAVDGKPIYVCKKEGAGK